MAAEIAYCVKCRKKREMKDAKEVSMKGGRAAMSGVCTHCGTKMFKILGLKGGAKKAPAKKAPAKKASAKKKR